MRRWVLLRGLGREAGHWGEFPHQLALATGDEVLAADLPGNGLRYAERSPTSVVTMVTDCRARLAFPGQTVLLALSLGAMVAIEWARQAPDEIAGCILVNTSAGGASPFWRRLRPCNYLTIFRALAPGTNPATREAAVLRMTTSALVSRADVLPQWSAIARDRPVSPPNAARQLWAAARYRVPDATPAVPMLLLASAQDALVHPSCSARLGQMWGTDLESHPWAGHDLPLDDPRWVLDHVTRWSRRALP